MKEPLTEDEKDFGAIMGFVSAAEFHFKMKGNKESQRKAAWCADRLSELYESIYGPNRPVHEDFWPTRIPDDYKLKETK